MTKLLAVLAREVRKALPAILFFLVLFHLIALTKAVSLDDHDFTAWRAAWATLAALIVAKAILLVDALVSHRVSSGRLAVRALWKTLLYGGVVLIFRLLEELIPLVARHGDLGAGAEALLAEVSWPLFTVLALWILAGLFLYTLAAELVDILGKARVKEVLLGAREPTGG